MQTFLPYKSYEKSAQVLDNKRLGKQRVECYQIVLALSDPTYGWQNHPAVKMWRGYSNSLIEYGIAICDEWIKRGYKDTLKDRLRNMYPWHQPAPKPPWIGNHQFHRSHKSNLVRKHPGHYRKYWPTIPDNLEYVWPGK